MNSLETLTAQVQRYAALTERPEADFSSISRALAELNAPAAGYAAASLAPETQSALEQLMVACVNVEPVWALQVGVRLWASGRQQPHDFSNLWNCARYAGIHSRFSAFTPEQHLSHLATLHGADLAHAHNPVPFIVRGNALRQLHRYGEAESAYLEGLSTCPDNPFLKFRLIDMWLMTYQHARANDLLASLRSRYPYALEHLFALPVPETAQAPGDVFTGLDAQGAELVWLVAADPVYIQRYGLRLAQGIATLLNAAPDSPRIHLHVHGIVEAGTPLPMEVLQAMAGISPRLSLHFTQREVNLQGATPNQRKAFFASERFLFLHELLQKYKRPMLVTDIDVDPMQHPAQLVRAVGDGDIGHTRFGTVRDAWDRYPATALVFQPTEAAITFCQRLSATILSLLGQHPEPWFVDQVALFRLIEGGSTPAKLTYLPLILTDGDSPLAYFRILHGSWTAQ